jgi:Fibronectin type III domain
MRPAAARVRVKQRIGALAAVALVVALLWPATAVAAGEPDLSISRSGPSTAGVNSPFTETLKITNHGTASTPGIEIAYAPGTPTITGTTPGLTCTAYPSRYGRHWYCTEPTIPGGLAPGASTTATLSVTQPYAGTLNESFTVYPYPAATQLNQVSHTATATVSVFIPPKPAAPTGVTATQSGDQFNVSWTPAAATASYLTSSLITATPTGGSTAPVLTARIAGTAASGAVSGLLASTTYSVTVTNSDAGGTGPASAPVLVTSQPATVPPSAPTITYYWGYANIRWTAPSPGNSVIDQYEVMATGGGQTLTSYVSGSTLADYLTPQPADLLTVTVRAHNAAGWGPWSTPVYFSDGGGG